MQYFNTMNRHLIVCKKQQIGQKRSLNEIVSYLCSWLGKLWLLPFVTSPWLLWWKWTNCFWWYNNGNGIRLCAI